MATPPNTNCYVVVQIMESRRTIWDLRVQMMTMLFCSLLTDVRVAPTLRVVFLLLWSNHGQPLKEKKRQGTIWYPFASSKEEERDTSVPKQKKSRKDRSQGIQSKSNGITSVETFQEVTLSNNDQSRRTGNLERKGKVERCKTKQERSRSIGCQNQCIIFQLESVTFIYKNQQRVPLILYIQYQQKI